VTVELGTNRVVGSNPARILNEAEAALARPRATNETPRVPLWDGKTADRILDAIAESSR
jgi:UDP-N-acetylglucosamine 2-epimerase (non-hydrolysing)